MVRLSRERPIHPVFRHIDPRMAFIELRERHEHTGWSRLLFGRAFKVALRHFVSPELLTPLPGLGQCLGVLWRYADGLLQASFGGVIVIAQAISPPKVQEDSRVGRVQTGGALEGVDGLLVILAPPRLGHVMKHPGNRPLRDQPFPFHNHAGRMKGTCPQGKRTLTEEKQCRAWFATAPAGHSISGESRPLAQPPWRCGGKAQRRRRCGGGLAGASDSGKEARRVQAVRRRFNAPPGSLRLARRPPTGMLHRDSTEIGGTRRQPESL